MKKMVIRENTIQNMENIDPPKKEKKKPAAKRIMRVTWAFTLLFLCLAGYIMYYSATHKQELINNSYNGRQQMLLAQNRRGNILSRNGEILATTVVNEQGEEVRSFFPMWWDTR